MRSNEVNKGNRIEGSIKTIRKVFQEVASGRICAGIEKRAQRRLGHFLQSRFQFFDQGDRVDPNFDAVSFNA